jgi:hypothetical protein
MEYIQGETLADFIRRKPDVPAVVTIRWMEDLCSAVGYAHERGIIHRDIKPANLMVDAYGRLKVLDFGIARMRGTLASQSTAVIGTPGYVAPEQIRGGAIDHRSDLFSIGVVAYELFSFSEPFGAESMHAITHRTLNDDPVPLDVIRPEVDSELAAVVARALEKGTAERFQTADELREALAAVRRRLEAAEPEATMAMYLPPAVRADEPPARPSGSLDDAGAAAGEQPGRHRRTTRESLARQRATQVQGWIDLAREHRAAGELAEAREACTQALSLDPANAVALELLNTLEEIAGRTMLRPSASAPSGADRSDGTVLLPSDRRNTPAPRPAQTQGPPPGPLASPVPMAAAPGVSAVSGPRGPAPAPVRDARPSGSTAAAGRWPVTPGGAAVAGIVLLLVAVAGWMLTRPAAVPPVLMVIDAAPWATITSVRRDGGEAESLPGNASTPLALTVAPGTYRVSLTGPPPRSETREVSIQIDEAGEAPVILERFTPMSVDDYFRVPAAADAPPPPGGQP